MELHSPAFENAQPIPALFTHDGENISPPLHWSNVPEDTQSLALIVEDPDAPSGVFTHWVIYNLPPMMQGLDREVPEGGHYGDQAQQGINDFHTMGYGGPRPPSGEHRYIFRLFALDKMLRLDSEVTKEILLQAIEGHVLAEATLTGLYAKHERGDVALEHELSAERSQEDAYDRSVHYDEKQPEADIRIQQGSS